MNLPDGPDVSILLALRCVGSPPVGRCLEVVEVPTKELQARDSLASFLFRRGKWLLSVISSGGGRVVVSPLCPKCCKKAYPPALLQLAYEELEGRA